MSIREIFKKAKCGKKEFDVSLKKYTTYRIDTIARLIVSPKDIDDLKEVIRLIKEYNEAKFANNYKQLINLMVLDDEIETEKETIVKDESQMTKEELYEWQKQKQKNKKLALKIEEKISKLEDEIRILNEEYTKEENQTDFNKLCEINLSIEEKNKEIENLMTQWETLVTE